MGQIAYLTNAGLGSAPLPDNRIIITGVPGTDRITATYANQAAGYSVLMKFSPRGTLKHAIMAEIGRLERERDGLSIPGLERLQSSRASRAQLFVSYLAERGMADRINGTAAKISSGHFLSMAEEVDPLVDEVCRTIAQDANIDGSVKEALIDYVATGDVPHHLFNHLSRHVSVLGEIAAYDALRKEAACNQSPKEKADLEKRVGSVIDSLWLFLGVEGSAEVKRKDGITGSVQAVHYGKTSDIDLPEHLAQKYLPVQRLTQYVTVLEKTLSEIFLHYLSNLKLSDILDADSAHQLTKGLEMRPGIVLRSVLPENEAVRKLYPDSRVAINNDPTLSAKISAAAAEHQISGLIAKIAAPHYNLSEEEAAQGIKTLAALLDSLMPLLPFDIYDNIVMSHRAEDLNEQMRSIHRQIKGLGPVKSLSGHAGHHRNLLLSQYQMLDRQEKRIRGERSRLMQMMNTTFGIDAETMIQYDGETVEGVIRLFGEEKVGFIRHVLRQDMGAVGEAEEASKQKVPE